MILFMNKFAFILCVIVEYCIAKISFFNLLLRLVNSYDGNLGTVDFVQTGFFDEAKCDECSSTVHFFVINRLSCCKLYMYS